VATFEDPEIAQSVLRGYGEHSVSFESYTLDIVPDIVARRVESEAGTPQMSPRASPGSPKRQDKMDSPRGSPASPKAGLVRNESTISRLAESALKRVPSEASVGHARPRRLSSMHKRRLSTVSSRRGSVLGSMSLTSSRPGRRKDPKKKLKKEATLEEVSVPRVGRENLGLLLDAGDGPTSGSLILTDVEPHSAADRAGVWKFLGWKLTRVNGVATQHIDDARDAATAAATVVLRFEQQNKLMGTDFRKKPDVLP